MRSIGFDISRPPICFIRHPREFTTEEFEKLFANLREGLVEGQKYAFLVDLREVDPLRGGAKVRQRSSVILRENREFMERFVVCEARVSYGAMTQGILTVIDWLTAQPWPQKNFRSGEMAEHWLRAQLLKHGLTPPAEPIWVEDARWRDADKQP